MFLLSYDFTSLERCVLSYDDENDGNIFTTTIVDDGIIFIALVKTVTLNDTEATRSSCRRRRKVGMGAVLWSFSKRMCRWRRHTQKGMKHDINTL